jgi:hypothetical protein
VHVLGQRALGINNSESRVPPKILKLVERDKALGTRKSSVCNQNPSQLMNGCWFEKKK